MCFMMAKSSEPPLFTFLGQKALAGLIALIGPSSVFPTLNQLASPNDLCPQAPPLL